MTLQPPRSTLFPYTTLFRSLPEVFLRQRKVAWLVEEIRVRHRQVRGREPRIELDRARERGALLGELVQAAVHAGEAEPRARAARILVRQLLRGGELRGEIVVQEPLADRDEQSFAVAAVARARRFLQARRELLGR